MRKQRFFLLTLIAFILGACQKDELTLPTSVDVNFNLIPFTNNEIETQSAEILLKNSSLSQANTPNQNTAPGLIKKMEIFKASFFITDIIIDGKREQGEDVYEKIPFDPPLEIKLDENTTVSQKLSFDIPQGIYQKLNIQLFLGNEELPALEFSGVVTSGKSQPVIFNYQFGLKQEITIQGKREDGRPTDNIILNKNQKEQAYLTLDAAYFFKYFPVFLLTQHKKEELTEESTITISNKNEKDMPFFTTLQGRLEESFSFVFE